MAYEMTVLQNGRLEVRCAPGEIVHITFRFSDDTWAVDEDPERQVFLTRSEALDRARFIGNDPDLPVG
jgi:hypothetical protein